MTITEVRVKMVSDSSERLRAFCSVTIDDAFVVRDLKVIDGDDGPFVAMPSRKLSDRCTRCGEKNHLRSKYCNECGQRLNPGRAPRGPDGRVKLYADVAHPINVECREEIQTAIIEAYRQELMAFEASGGAGYDADSDDYEFADELESDDSGFDDLVAELRSSGREKKETYRDRPDRVRGGVETPDSSVTPIPTEDEEFESDDDLEVETESSDSELGNDDDDFAAGLDWVESPKPRSKDNRRDAGLGAAEFPRESKHAGSVPVDEPNPPPPQTDIETNEDPNEQSDSAVDDGFASGIL